MSRYKKHIPNNLRKFRRLMGFSQEEVKRKLRLSSMSIVSRWERGLTMPDSDNLLKLGRLYKTLIEELYYHVVKEYEKDLFNEKVRKPPSKVTLPKHFDKGP